jgi:2-amino-4-hydroxy-6-hydroxymethyldihydropteridine diphosphokinase
MLRIKIISSTAHVRYDNPAGISITSVNSPPSSLLIIIQIRTLLKPTELLERLQSIENELGRVKVRDKGPRNIDLDILLYDEEIIQTDRLQVPHKLMHEREFVLRPLCE